VFSDVTILSVLFYIVSLSSTESTTPSRQSWGISTAVASTFIWGGFSTGAKLLHIVIGNRGAKASEN